MNGRQPTARVPRGEKQYKSEYKEHSKAEKSCDAQNGDDRYFHDKHANL